VGNRGHALGSAHGELADALEVALDHNVIFNHGKGQWHVVNEKNGLWLPDKMREVPRRADKIASDQLDSLWPQMKADDEKAKKDYKTWMKLRDVQHTDATLKRLSEREEYRTDGSVFDQDQNLLGVKNGMVDLETLKFYTGADVRGKHISMAAAVEWPDLTIEEAYEQAKPFLDFMLDVMSADADVTTYLGRLMGYCLIGTTQEEKFWLMVGDGRNGKGTLTKFMHWLLGDYGTFLDPALYIRNKWGDPGADRAKPELGNLWGKRYAVTSEPVKGAFNEEMLKAHTGRDPITFRRMRQDTLWTFDPTFKLFFLTQHAPRVEDVGPSMRARARVIHFNQSYVGRENPRLQESFKAIGPAILTVLAHQAQQYLLHGLPESAKVLEWSDEYINENDPLSQFVADRCEAKRGLTAQAALVYDAYVEWANGGGTTDLMSQTAFGRALSVKYPKSRTRTGTVYEGIRLLGATEVAAEESE